MYANLRDHTYKYKQTKQELVPLLFAKINSQKGKEKWETVKVLIDSGASATIISEEFVKKLQVKKETATSWGTAAGTFTTTGKVNLEIQFPGIESVRHSTYGITCTQRVTSILQHDIR